jgi:predicted benzoate:H+ symporter BenE
VAFSPGTAELVGPAFILQATLFLLTPLAVLVLAVRHAAPSLVLKNSETSQPRTTSLLDMIAVHSQRVGWWRSFML